MYKLNISIATINFNNVEGLKATLESVERQAKLIEKYIIIDGGSSDGSLELLNEYRHSSSLNLQIISEPDNGISDAFNKGVRMSRSAWTLLLNSGDLLGDHYYQKMSKAIAKSKNKIFFGDVLMDDGTFIPGDPNYARLIPFVMPRLNHPTCLIHKSVYEKVGLYRTDLKIAMDYEFLQRASKLFKFEYVKGAVNIMETAGVSNTFVKEMRREVLSLSNNRLISTLMFIYNDIRR